MLEWTQNEIRARISFVGRKLFELRNKSGKEKSAVVKERFIQKGSASVCECLT